jgi:hypothetical protein
MRRRFDLRRPEPVLQRSHQPVSPLYGDCGLYTATNLHRYEPKQQLPVAMHVGRRLRERAQQQPRLQSGDDDVRAVSKQHALRK